MMSYLCVMLFFFFFKQKTAYEMRISDWSSDVCSSDLGIDRIFHKPIEFLGATRQYIHGNWKLYMENVRDGYHASLLHAFHATFNLVRSNQKARVISENNDLHTCGDLFITPDPTGASDYKDKIGRAHV